MKFVSRLLSLCGVAAVFVGPFAVCEVAGDPIDLYTGGNPGDATVRKSAYFKLNFRDSLSPRPLFAPEPRVRTALGLSSARYAAPEHTAYATTLKLDFPLLSIWIPAHSDENTTYLGDVDLAVAYPVVFSSKSGSSKWSIYFGPTFRFGDELGPMRDDNSYGVRTLFDSETNGLWLSAPIAVRSFAVSSLQGPRESAAAVADVGVRLGIPIRKSFSDDILLQLEGSAHVALNETYVGRGALDVGGGLFWRRKSWEFGVSAAKRLETAKFSDRLVWGAGPLDEADWTSELSVSYAPVELLSR